MIDVEGIARLVPMLRAGAIAAAPREVCGLLLLDASGAWRAARVRNVAAHPSGFAFDGLDFARVERAARARCERVAGYFHSHGAESVNASAADRMGVLWGDRPPYWRLIISITGEWALYDARVKGWRVVAQEICAGWGAGSAVRGRPREGSGGARRSGGASLNRRLSRAARIGRSGE